MSESKVYFTNLRTTGGRSLLVKLHALMKAAGFEGLNLENKYVAIKMHFGEPGNLAFLRPNYAKVVADYVKELGGKPFLTDCNTLYVGGRKNALDHLDAACGNGFSPLTTGCHVLIADGLKGTDEAYIPVENGKHVKEAKIGRAVADADVIISLTHFKGHEQTGFGGALKNLGMGCGSRAGKMEMHNAGKPKVAKKLCVGCGSCTKICEPKAILVGENKKASVDHSICVGCGRCIGVCPTDAVYSAYDEAVTVLNEKIAEYTYAVLKDKQHFHISLVIDISPNCDCHDENDAPIVPDVGMFASFDPVALDLACADAVNRQTPLPNTCLTDMENTLSDHFDHTHPDTDWRSQVRHGVELGLGQDQYEIVVVQ